MRLTWGSQLDPKFLLGLAGAYLVLGTAELLLFVFGRHQVIQALMAVGFITLSAAWLAMYLHRRNQPPFR